MEPVYFGLVVFLCAVLLKVWARPGRTSPLPPGPRRLPLIGNLLDMPSVKAWEGFAELASEYGTVLCTVRFSSLMANLLRFQET